MNGQACLAGGFGHGRKPILMGGLVLSIKPRLCWAGVKMILLQDMAGRAHIPEIWGAETPVVAGKLEGNLAPSGRQQANKFGFGKIGIVALAVGTDLTSDHFLFVSSACNYAPRPQ